MAVVRPRIAVTPPNFDADAIAFLEGAGFTVDLVCEKARKAEGDFHPDDLLARIAGAAGWIIGPQAHVTREVMAALPDCRVFARRGVGYERIDVAGARDLGRVVAIAAGGNDASVADHVMGLMLAVGRRMREQQLAMQAGDWSIRVSTDLFRKTVGLIGLGRTARALVQRLKGFEARILVTTPRPDAVFVVANSLHVVDLPTLLGESDYVSLHAPLSAATHHLIGADELAFMRASAFLINAGRGGLVDDAALLAALTNHRIAGAGLDVYEGESDPARRTIADALVALPNVVATPHAAASTREGLARTNHVAAACVAAILTGDEPPTGCVVAGGR